MNTQIKNISIVGHGQTGKSTLVEKILSLSEEKSKEKPESDFTDLEKHHNMSLYTSIFRMRWKESDITLLDTPGSSDFVGEVVSAFRVSDSTVMMINGGEGIQIETIKLWRRLDARERPRMIFINHMDNNKAKYTEIIDELRAQFKAHFVPLSVPYKKKEELVGIYDLINDSFYISGKTAASKIDDEAKKSIVNQYKEQLIEAAAEGDDQLMGKYLETENLSLSETWKGLMEGFNDNRIVPVFAGSLEHDMGLIPLLNFFNAACPSPLGTEEKIFTKDNSEKALAIDAKASPAFFVFKTRIDQFTGKLSYIKLMRGTLSKDTELMNEREDKKEKIMHLFLPQGKFFDEVGE